MEASVVHQDNITIGNVVFQRVNDAVGLLLGTACAATTVIRNSLWIQSDVVTRILTPSDVVLATFSNSLPGGRKKFVSAPLPVTDRSIKRVSMISCRIQSAYAAPPDVPEILEGFHGLIIS